MERKTRTPNKVRVRRNRSDIRQALLESRERIVNAAQQDFASSRSLNLVRDGHAVGFIANPNDCQHHHQFEIAQNRCRCHLFEILE